MQFTRSTLLASVAAFAASAAVPAVAQAPKAYTSGGVPEESILSALWADQDGLFRRAGLAMTIESQRSGSAVAAAVAGGAYALGKSSLSALIAAHVKGVPFVLVAPGGLYNASHPNVALLVKADSPIRSGADCNGKTVAVSSLGDLYTIATKAWVDQHGGDSTTLKLVEIPTDAVGNTLTSGRVDIAGVGTPQLQEFLDAGGFRVLGRCYDSVASRFMFSAWFTTRQFLAENRTVVASFARAIHDAAVYCNAHPAQTVETLAGFTGVDATVIAKMPRAEMGTVLDPRLIQPVIDLDAKYNVIPAPFPAADFIEAGLVPEGKSR